MVTIVQSLFLYEDKFTYKDHIEKPDISLNFYSNLLSYITLKKYFFSVTIVCNQYAYDTIIKFIPYDNVIIDEEHFNKEDFDKYWTIKKISSYKHVNTPFIHVDGDVMLFENVLKEFQIGEYDIICQNIENINNYDHYLKYNDLLYNKLIDLNIFKTRNSKSIAINCAVVGIKTDTIKNEYLNRCKLIYNAVYNEYSNKLDSTFPIYLEQFVLGTIVLDYNLKVYEVLNENIIKKCGILNAGDQIGYTHLWGNSKFKPKYINLIKRKIELEYSKYYQLIQIFEYKHKDLKYEM